MKSSKIWKFQINIKKYKIINSRIILYNILIAFGFISNGYLYFEFKKSFFTRNFSTHSFKLVYI